MILYVLYFLDLSAALDKVDHKFLLHTLGYEFGIIGSALAWIKSYLSGHYQTVYINGASSRKRPLSCAVLQGSVLGPKLFKMYTLAQCRDTKASWNTLPLLCCDGQLYIVFDFPTDDNPHTVGMCQ